jgi:hypothetical protein
MARPIQQLPTPINKFVRLHHRGLFQTTWSIINLPTYKMATGMAERIMRRIAFVIVRAGLVSQTSLKKRGRFPNAENLSFKEMRVEFTVF